MSHFLDVGPRIKNESDAETPDKRTSSSPASSAMSEAVTPSIMVSHATTGNIVFDRGQNDLIAKGGFGKRLTHLHTFH